MNTEEEHRLSQIMCKVVGLEKQESLIMESVADGKGILLVGWAGVGKTMLAKSLIKKCSSERVRWNYLHASELAVRGQAGIQLISTIIHNFKESPSICEKLILVIDQFDLLAEFRKMYCENLPNLVAAVNGQKKEIVLMAITNRPRFIGPTCLTYLKIKIQVPLPNEETRFFILKNNLEEAKIDLSEDDILDIARLSGKFTPCDINQFVRDVSYISVRKFIKSKSFKKVEGRYIGLKNDEGKIKNYLDIKANDIMLQKIGRDEVMSTFKEAKSSFNEEQYQEMLKYAGMWFGQNE